MTYLGFLAFFLVVPLLVLSLIALRLGLFKSKWAVGALLVHVGLAIAYTTPWDNYLVATHVWWYDPARVLGITLGWVPLEEYLFFVIQTLFTGLIVLWGIQRWPQAERHAIDPRLRWLPTGAVVGLWLAALIALAAGWKPATYLALELAWALPPIALQLAVGTDLLWRYRWRVGATLAGVTLYLSCADAIAIQSGVWTIDPTQSFHILLGGVLPLEEAVFFLVTNTLIVFGLTLALAPELPERWQSIRNLVGGKSQVPQKV
jgi:lycopene cyclase domain-containing protein